MKKSDIVSNVSKKTGITREAVQAVIDEAIEAVTDALTNGEPVYIRGLFTLSTVKRAKKCTRNILKGEAMLTPEHYAPHAKFSSELRGKIRELPIK